MDIKLLRELLVPNYYYKNIYKFNFTITNNTNMKYKTN